MPDAQINPAMTSDLASALQDAFVQLIEKVKSRRPVGTDKKPTELGFVYSQLVQGMMINPDDYSNPWRPSGGSSVADSVKEGSLPQASSPNDAANADTSTTLTADRNVSRRLDAAFMTSMMVDRMIMVTKDGTYQEFSAARRLSEVYGQIIGGMQALPPPPMDPKVKDRIAEAQKVLFVPDDDGDYIIKSKIYKLYEKNARAYAEATANFGEAYARSRRDPVLADSWLARAKQLQLEVDQAWETLKGEGGEKVADALATLESVGGSIDEKMIAKARKIFDQWNLNLAGGVAVTVPYAYCTPTTWPDFENDDVGWTHIHVDSSSYEQHRGDNTQIFDRSRRETSRNNTSVSAGGAYLGFGASGGYQRANARESDESAQEQNLSSFFKNDAKNVTLDFEFGIVDIERPWLLGNLFYLKNWYMTGQRKNTISDGTIDGQADSLDHMLPMIPVQFLVVRNVKITAESWGSDGDKLSKLFGEQGGAWDNSSSGWNASTNVGFGFFSAKANVSHSQAKEGASRYGKVDRTEREDYEASFKDGVFEIRGAQIVAFLSTIVPTCPPLDDPHIDS